MATYDIDSLPASFNVGDIINCPYSGTIKSITLPSGKYKFELWGGGVEAIFDGGDRYHDGGYTVGNYSINSPTTLYLVAGGGGTPSINAGYNGGGPLGGDVVLKGIAPQIYYAQMSKSTCGGGATHIALVPGLLSEIGASNLSSILAVAGGSGGPDVFRKSGTSFLKSVSFGSGGGVTGLPTSGGFEGKGGTQSAGGAGGRFLSQMIAESGSFGKGGSGHTGRYTEFVFSDTQSICMYASGGGGGLYGGGGAVPAVSNGEFVALANAGGGSGYVSDLLEEATTYNPDDSTPESPTDTVCDGYIRITVLRLGSFTAKVNGLWTPVTPLVKVNNTWKDVKKSYVKVNGIWKEV